MSGVGLETIARAEALRTDGDELARAMQHLGEILAVPVAVLEQRLDDAAVAAAGVEAARQRVLSRCRADLAAL